MRRPALAVLVVLVAACDTAGPDDVLRDLPGATADVEALYRVDSWTLDAVHYRGRTYAPSAEDAAPFKAGFEPDGFFGTSGVYNATGGTYEADRSGALRIDVGVSTLVGGEGRLWEMEGAFVAALDAAERFETDGRTLQVTGRDGAAVRLRAD